MLQGGDHIRMSGASKSQATITQCHILFQLEWLNQSELKANTCRQSQVWAKGM